MGEGVAIVITKGAFRSGTKVSEDQGRGCLGCYSLQVDAVPGRNGRRKDAGFRAKLGIGVIAYAKAIA